MGEDSKIFVFVSSGRCGTQWLATNLRELYADLALVNHEPLGALYRPREFFRAYSQVEQYARVPEVARHLEDIEHVLASKNYIETGWPLFAAVPLFASRFPHRVVIVHLIRHPIPTSISHMVHQSYYGSPRDDPYTRLATLDPSRPGAFQRDLQRVWPDMTPFEKCLFWWTEVNLYACELSSRFPDAYRGAIKSEELLAGREDALKQVVSYLELPWRGELRKRTKHIVDEWHHHTTRDFDWRRIFRYPRAVEVARMFGYDFESIDDGLLEERYRGDPPE